MVGQVNRASQLWENWEQQEKQIQNLAGITDDRRSLMYKYDFLRKGLYRVSVKPSEKEKLIIQAISIVTSKLRKQLYPNPTVRLLHRLFSFAIYKPANLRAFNKNKAQNLESLKGQLKTIGLHHFTGKLENLDYESPKVDFKSLSRLNDNSKLEVTIDLEKDKSGSYRFNSFTATLISENGEKNSCTFSAENKINLTEAVNLLQGRSVYKKQENADGTTSKMWVQLDQKQRDLNGNPELLTFSPNYDYDLKQVLQDHSIKLEFYSIFQDAVKRGLEAGNTVGFEIPGKGQYYITADPAGRGVQFFDPEKRPISITALRKIIHPVNKTVHKDFNLIKQKDIPQENQMHISR